MLYISYSINVGRISSIDGAHTKINSFHYRKEKAPLISTTQPYAEDEKSTRIPRNSDERRLVLEILRKRYSDFVRSYRAAKLDDKNGKLYRYSPPTRFHSSVKDLRALMCASHC